MLSHSLSSKCTSWTNVSSPHCSTCFAINGEYNVKQQSKTLPPKHGRGIFISNCVITNIVGKTNDYGAMLDPVTREPIMVSTGSIVHAASLCPHLSELGRVQAREVGIQESDIACPISGIVVGMGLDVRGHHIKGVFGIRLAAVKDVNLDTNRIDNVVNLAQPIGGRCVVGTAAGVSIRACAGVMMAQDNMISGVSMPVDETRAADVLSE